MRKPGRADDGFATREITVPAEIAAQIPDGSTFLPELNDDGLLFRPVHVPATDRGPDWLAGNEEVTHGYAGTD